MVGKCEIDSDFLQGFTARGQGTAGMEHLWSGGHSRDFISCSSWLLLDGVSSLTKRVCNRL